MPFQCTCEHCGKPFFARTRVKPNRFCSAACRRAPRALAAQDDGSVVVPLTRGKVAIIDAEDAERVGAFRWCFDGRYAARSDAQRRYTSMHRFILNPPEDAQVDHVSGDKLDNRRANLRLATSTENRWNCGPSRVNTSGYRGIYLHRQSQRWNATIHVHGRKMSLGYFATREDAARAYDVAAKKFHGQFAHLNFPDD